MRLINFRTVGLHLVWLTWTNIESKGEENKKNAHFKQKGTCFSWFLCIFKEKIAFLLIFKRGSVRKTDALFV